MYDILDLCLACKGCKSECPSGVDMAKLKSEFLQHYNDLHPPSLRTRLIASLPAIYSLFSFITRDIQLLCIKQDYITDNQEDNRICPATKHPAAGPCDLQEVAENKPEKLNPAKPVGRGLPVH